MSRVIPLNVKEYPDDPVIAKPVLDQIEVMRSWDDSQAAKAVKSGDWWIRTAAKMVLEQRLRYEIQNSGEWKSGPYVPVPWPPQRYAHFRRNSWGGYHAMAPQERRRRRRS